MQSSFELGGQYRNRRGEFEVLEIDGDAMRIRYSDGTEQDTTVGLQQRIHERIVWQSEQAKKAANVSTRKGHKRSAKSSFAGLLDTDFQSGVTGTHWRARDSLGGLLASKMSAMTGREYTSIPVFRRPEVHVVDLAGYSAEDKTERAKLALGLDADAARYGLYIERGSAGQSPGRHWSIFCEVMAKEGDLSRELQSSLISNGMFLEALAFDDGDLLGKQRIEVTESGLVLSAGEENEVIAWPDLPEHLAALWPEQHLDVWLCGSLESADVLAKGTAFSGHVVKAYSAVLPLYEAIVSRDSK